MVDMQEFLKEYNKQYDFIYKSNQENIYVAGTNESIEYFDNSRTAEESKILKDFVLFRGDFISSDRETAAFMFTIDKFI